MIFNDWLLFKEFDLGIKVKKKPREQKEHPCEECGCDAVTSFYANKSNTECSNISCKTNKESK